jgi:hypothetical protein
VLVVLAGAFLAGGGRDRCETLQAGCLAAAAAGAPDPGGAGAPGAPVPPPGKAWGFNLGVEPAGDTGRPGPGIRALGLVQATHHRYPVAWTATGPSSPQDPVGPELRRPLGQAGTGGLQGYDRIYRALVDAGITPVIILMDVPRWASTLHECLGLGFRLTHPQTCPPGWEGGLHLPAPAFFEQWRAWAAAVAARYPEAILEGPNEPDMAVAQNYPSKVEPRGAAAIQCELRRAVPRRRLLSMGLFDPAYIAEYVPAAKGCSDVLSIHAYPGEGGALGADSNFARVLASARDALRAAGDRSPIWVTETGMPFRPSATQPVPSAADEQRAAEVTREAYDRLAAMDDVRGIFFHTLRDAPIEIHDDPANSEFWFGFFARDWQPKSRACSFLAPGTPALGPCSAVPEAAVRATARRAAKRRRCRTVVRKRRSAQTGRKVTRRVRVCRRRS